MGDDLLDSLLDDPLLANVPVHEGYKVLGGVVLYQKLGRGGMGAVYKGRHLRLDIDVALKVTALPPGTPPERSEDFVKRFIREARTAAAVRHPNLIRVYDVNAEAGVHYLIMDYVEGESAADRLERRGASGEGRLSEQEAVEICLGAAEGLAAAHSQGIVHRDVKPDNILIDKKGNVVVADLGLAKAYVAEDEGKRPTKVTQTGVALGTPHYMSPEQFRPAEGVGPGSDVWSLGVTLYQLLTARLPWTGANVFLIADNVRKRKLPDPKELCGSLSDGVCRIMRKATQKKASRRYADCGEVVRVLREHLDSVKTSQKSALPDAKAGATKMVLATVTPPDARTMTLIGEAALGPELAPAREVRVDEVIEKRMDLEERVDRFESEHPDADEETLAEIRKHLRVAEAAEGKDAAAALARVGMAERKLAEQRDAIEKAKAEEAERKRQEEEAARVAEEEAERKRKEAEARKGKKCRGCGLVNPSIAEQCDCGYYFPDRRVSGREAQAPHTKQSEDAEFVEDVVEDEAGQAEEEREYRQRMLRDSSRKMFDRETVLKAARYVAEMDRLGYLDRKQEKDSAEMQAEVPGPVVRPETESQPLTLRCDRCGHQYDPRTVPSVRTVDLGGFLCPTCSREYQREYQEGSVLAEVYYNSGLTKHSKGDWDGAIDDYDKAIELNPAFASAYHQRALAKSDKGDTEGASRDSVAARLLGYSGTA